MTTLSWLTHYGKTSSLHPLCKLDPPKYREEISHNISKEIQGYLLSGIHTDGAKSFPKMY
jgi:hypothetical protein